MSLEALDLDITELDPANYKVIGGTHVISKELMRKNVSNGNCIAVAHKSKIHHANENDGLDLTSEEINWICEDDFEQYWENNCMSVRPQIEQCLDELTLAKHHGDPAILKHVLEKYEKKSDDSEDKKD